VQLLAAGSPTFAIPLFMQVITSSPDGPEPHAMLSLAYALDLQADRAIQEAREARRHRPANDPPGWEWVALGIAEMTQHRPAEALKHLEEVIAAAPRRSPIEWAARQWRTMALILGGDHDKAAASLGELIDYGSTRMTALLWATILHAQQRRTANASQSLIQAAIEASAGSGAKLDKDAPAGMDDQSLYDAAVSCVGQGELAKGETLLGILRQRNPDAGDVPVWLALLAVVKGEWTAGQEQLKDACQVGSPQSRALANHLLGVVYALEDRPDLMIQSMVVGQRLLSTSSVPVHITSQPRRDAVWLSDSMK
jgi:tetratricopeptide (TPR) repeat protein